MKRKALLLALPLLLSLVAPAQAQNAVSKPRNKTVATKMYSTEVSENDSDSKPAGKKSIVSSALGVTCGVAVGIPVRIARDTKKYTVMMRKSMIDGVGVEAHGDLVGQMFATGCAVPFGIGTGLIHGSVRGFEQGVKTGKEKPFSKESMSLGELTDEK